jgi:AraC-like DNA-binding protein
MDIPLRGLRVVVAALESLGVDSRAYLAANGLTGEQLVDPASRMSRPRWIAAWRSAAEMSRDPQFGVTAAELTPVTLFIHVANETEFLLVQLMASSATVAEALDRYARFATIGLLAGEVARRGDEVVIELDTSEDPPQALIDFHTRFLTKFLAELPEKAVAVTVRGTTIAFPEAAQRLKLRSSRPQLAARLEQLAARTMTFEAEVAIAIEARLDTGEDASAGAIARQLGISVRTLGRRLADDGASHRALVDKVRARLAERYLSGGKLSIKEIAHRLGFADGSAFHRAYRRWFGHAPTARPDGS